MEMGPKCPYGGALDKPIKCRRTDGGNEFMAHNNRPPELKQGKSSGPGQTFFFIITIYNQFYMKCFICSFFFSAQECALANKREHSHIHS